MTNELRGGLIGCGYFARNHLHGWGEVDGARIATVCDLDPARARDYAEEFDVPGVYSDVREMLRAEQLDFVDIVTQPATHRELVEIVASHQVPVICQKPLAQSLEDARMIVRACQDAAIPLMVHENFRWQSPMRALKEASSDLGDLFFGRISFRSAFDVYTNQPYLAEDPRFIIYDLGVHLLDLARFFFGEVKQLTCQTSRVNPRIKGEDVATIMLQMASGATCIVDLSYASQQEEELFPQTLINLEGALGSASLGPHYRLAVSHDGSTSERFVPPQHYPWSAEPGAAIQESVVNIQQHWVDCLREGKEPETSGRDNLHTIELVFGAYESADSGMPYRIGGSTWSPSEY